MIIDMHCHIEFGEKSSNKGHEALRWQVEKFLKQTSADVALLQPYSIKDKSFNGYLKLNKELADYIKKSSHYGLARIDPVSLSKEETEKLIRKCIKMGLSGIKLHPLDGYLLRDLSNYKFIFDLAQELKIPVMVHTWFGAENSKLGLKREPLKVVSKLAKNYTIPFIAAHANISEDMDFESAMQTPNLYVDISLQEFGPFKEYIEQNNNKKLINRIFYGSDFGVCKLPFFQQKDIITPQKIRENLPPIVADKILRRNAEKFINDYMRRK